jgi:hypothetical protein
MEAIENLGHRGQVSSTSRVETLMFFRAVSRQREPEPGVSCGDCGRLNAWPSCSDDTGCGDNWGRCGTRKGICPYVAFRRRTIPYLGAPRPTPAGGVSISQSGGPVDAVPSHPR